MARFLNYLARHGEKTAMRLSTCADIAIICAGGMSRDPFLAYAGVAGIAGVFIKSLSDKLKPFPELLMLSSAGSLVLAGVHPHMHLLIYDGVLIGTASILLGIPDRLLENARLQFLKNHRYKAVTVLFSASTLPLIGQAIVSRSIPLGVAALLYSTSNYAMSRQKPKELAYKG